MNERPSPTWIRKNFPVKDTARVEKFDTGFFPNLARDCHGRILADLQVPRKNIPEKRPLPFVEKKEATVSLDERPHCPMLDATRCFFHTHTRVHDERARMFGTARSALIPSHPIAILLVR
jgi:hypothetical protein